MPAKLEDETERDMRKAYSDWRGGRRYKNMIEITKAEWVQWWRETGVFDLRGSGKGQYYMKRIDPALPFSLDNIELRCYGKKGRVQ